jgi:hypothetical protein
MRSSPARGALDGNRNTGGPALPRTSSAQSCLQLMAEFIEKLKIRPLGNDPLWVQLDEACFAQAQRVETHRILSIILPPVVGQLTQGLQRVIITRSETSLDHPPCSQIRITCA